MYNDLITKNWIKDLYKKGHSVHSIHLITKESVQKIKVILNINKRG